MRIALVLIDNVMHSKEKCNVLVLNKFFNLFF